MFTVEILNSDVDSIFIYVTVNTDNWYRFPFKLTSGLAFGLIATSTNDWISLAVILASGWLPLGTTSGERNYMGRRRWRICRRAGYSSNYCLHNRLTDWLIYRSASCLLSSRHFCRLNAGPDTLVRQICNSSAGLTSAIVVQWIDEDLEIFYYFLWGLPPQTRCSFTWVSVKLTQSTQNI